MSNIQCLESFIKENPMEGFDICSQCGAIQEANTMQDINQTDFNIFCDECLQTATDDK